LQVLPVVHQARALEEAVFVVAGHALGHPEQARVVLARVVEGAEHVGADALDVPEVEVLVRDEVAVEVEQLGLIAEAEAPLDDGGRVEVFEPAAARGAEQEEEGVVAVRHLAHHLGLDLGDAPRVAPQPLRLVVALAVDDDAVRDAPDLEREGLEVAGEEGRVVEHVEVLGAEGVRRAGDGRQARRDLPVAEGLDLQRRGRAEQSVGVDEEVGVVPEGVAVVQLARAHAQLVGVDRVAHAHLARAAGLDAPGVLVRLRPRERAARPVARLEPLHVPLVLADEVGAGRPDRQEQVERGGRGRPVAQPRLHLEEVRVRPRHRDRVGDLRRVRGDCARALVNALRARGRHIKQGQKEIGR
jgi:hypothetical protein